MSHIFLIADSGATKTDWCLMQQSEPILHFETEGISPIYQSEEEIANYIKEHVYSVVQHIHVDAVSFYGSGCIPERIDIVRKAIQSSFLIDDIKVYSDLIGAAHSLCGKEAGIACIIGTGSNSCEWDGSKIVKQVPPLGFILGDEGSGGYMGKILVAGILKDQLPNHLKSKFLKQYDLTTAKIIESVYNNPFPSRFLASLTPFLLENIDEQSILDIITKSFSSFFERNIMQYNYHDYKVNFMGSIAYYYSSYLKEVASQKGINVGIINQSPMEGLINYYSTHL